MFILRTSNVNNDKAMWYIEVDRQTLVNKVLDSLTIDDSAKQLFNYIVKYLCNINHIRNETNNMIDGNWWSKSIITLYYNERVDKYYDDLKTLVNNKLIEFPYITSSDIKVCDEYYYLIYK